MSLFLRHLLVLSVLGVMLLLAFGCSQLDDVVQPQNRATITLRPYNLPELSEDYVYELWTLEIDGVDSNFNSLGRFLWDIYNVQFTDIAGNPIDSIYEIPGNWNNYDYLVVTVENRTDPSPGPSGSMMLMDEIVDPTDRPITLQFPADFSMTTGFYFVASPSDNNDYIDEEKGLWLCARAISQRQMQDTLGIIRFITTATQQADNETRSKTDPDTVGVTDYTVFNNSMVVIGYDTIWDHVRIELEWEVIVDTLSDYLLNIQFDTTTSVTHEYYNYAGPLDALPDIEAYGWRYNAWVFHEYFPEAANLPKMVPFGFERQNMFVADTNWSVLSLGAFNNPSVPDLSNPYTDDLEVPQFPGEDFLINTDGLAAIDLRYDGADATGAQWGSIVIGIEPIPNPSLISVDTTVNFPLFVMSDFLRSATHTRTDLIDTTIKYFDVGWVHSFHNWNQFLPEIRLEVEFHE